MVTKHISIGLEYLYTDINDDDYSVGVTAGPGIVAPTANPFVAADGTGGTNMRPRDQSLNYHAMRGTVNFRF
jgi:outer membrane immunogenic protein